MAQLKCENLTLGYEGHAVLSNLDFSVNAGDYLCIMGENGSGKSTLMKTVLGLIKPLGVYGVIATQLVTYLVLVTYRWHDMRRYFTLKIYHRTALPIVMLLVSAVPFYYCRNAVLDMAYMLAAIGCIAWSFRDELERQWKTFVTKTAGRIK